MTLGKKKKKIWSIVWCNNETGEKCMSLRNNLQAEIVARWYELFIVVSVTFMCCPRAYRSKLDFTSITNSYRIKFGFYPIKLTDEVPHSFTDMLRDCSLQQSINWHKNQSAQRPTQPYKAVAVSVILLLPCNTRKMDSGYFQSFLSPHFSPDFGSLNYLIFLFLHLMFSIIPFFISTFCSGHCACTIE